MKDELVNYFRDPDGIRLEFGAWWRPLTDDDINHEPARRADAPAALVHRSLLWKGVMTPVPAPAMAHEQAARSNGLITS
jgi:hypothetical protein